MKIITIHSPTSTSERLKSTYKGRDQDKMVRFLPCIAHAPTNDTEDSSGGVTYLVAYRVWRAFDLPRTKTTHPTTEGHPWYEGWGASSFDGTAFMTIRVDKRGKRATVLSDAIYENGNGKVDMRLLHIRDNLYHVAFNTFGRRNPVIHPTNADSMDPQLVPKCFYYVNKTTGKVNHNPSRRKLAGQLDSERTVDNYLDWGGCTFQNTSVLTVGQNKTPKYNRPSLICPSSHGRLEKNYSMFFDLRKRLCHQYAITPWSFLDHSCKVHTPMKTTLFKRVADYYDPRPVSPFAKNIVFSCSTPLISYNEHEYIAMGHFKLHYERIRSLPHNSPARVFTNKLKKELGISMFDHDKYPKKVHYELIYGMFVYTVNKKTWKLSRASKAFILMNKRRPNALCFPSGIIQHNKDKFITSYHENDINIKLWIADRSELESMLQYNERNTKPNKFEFSIIHV